MVSLTFRNKCCQFLLGSQSCHFQGEKQSGNFEDWIDGFQLVIKLRRWKPIIIFSYWILQSVTIISTIKSEKKYFLFFYLFLLLHEKHNCLQAKSRYRIRKNTLFKTLTQQKCRLMREINTFLSVFSPEAACFQFFDKEWTGLIRQRLTSECIFPRRHKIHC